MSHSGLAIFLSRSDLVELTTTLPLPSLAKCVSEPSDYLQEEFDVRWLAAIGLIGMNIKGLKPLLHVLMEQGDFIWVREGAHHVLHDLTRGELRKYLTPVLVALENTDTSAEVHTAALHALEMLDKDYKISNAWGHMS